MSDEFLEAIQTEFQETLLSGEADKAKALWRVLELYGFEPEDLGLFSDEAEDGSNPLNQLLRDKNYESARLLIDLLPDAINRCEEDGTFPLAVAAEQDEPEALELLLVEGFDPLSETNFEGQTAFECFLLQASNEQLEKVYKFLKAEQREELTELLKKRPILGVLETIANFDR